MLRRILAAVAVFTLTSAPAAWATDYTIDPNHSKVLFKVRHLGISTVTGRFEKFSGTFSFDPGNPTAFKAEATIDVQSINTDVPDRDKHLRSADFFDAEKNPQIIFVATGMKEIGKNKYEIPGNLTIRGVTKPVVLQAELGGIIKDQRGVERAAFTATGTVNRKDFGVSWNRTLDAGGVVVSDEVTMMLEVEATEKKTS